MIVAATRRTRTPFEFAHADRQVIGPLSRRAAKSYVTVLSEACRRDFDFRRLPETRAHVFVVREPTAGPGGRARLVVAGPRSRVLGVEHLPAEAAIVGVELLAGAGRSVLGVPLGELVDLIVPLEDLWGAPARELLDRIDEAKDERQQEHLLAGALSERTTPRRFEPLALAAALELERASGWLPVGELASRFGMGVRQLHRRFIDEVGMSPKRCARVERIRRLLCGRWTNGALAAAELGFGDQAHLIDEFRDLVGTTPGRFFSEEDYVESVLELGWLITPRLDGLPHEDAPMPASRRVG